MDKISLATQLLSCTAAEHAGTTWYIVTIIVMAALVHSNTSAAISFSSRRKTSDRGQAVRSFALGRARISSRAETAFETALKRLSDRQRTQAESGQCCTTSHRLANTAAHGCSSTAACLAIMNRFAGSLLCICDCPDRKAGVVVGPFSFFRARTCFLNMNCCAASLTCSSFVANNQLSRVQTVHNRPEAHSKS